MVEGKTCAMGEDAATCSNVERVVDEYMKIKALPIAQEVPGLGYELLKSSGLIGNLPLLIELESEYYDNRAQRSKSASIKSMHKRLLGRR